MTSPFFLAWCVTCRTNRAPSRSQAEHEAGETHQKAVRDPERRVRAGDRSDRSCPPSPHAYTIVRHDKVGCDRISPDGQLCNLARTDPLHRSEAAR